MPGQDNLDLNPAPKFQPKVWHLPVQVGAGLLVFATTMTLLNKSDPTTAQEEMETENLVKWAISNLAGALTMQGLAQAHASFQRDIWPLITRYLNQKRNNSLNNDTEISVQEVRENIQTFVKNWFLNSTAAYCGFTAFSIESTALTLLNYDTFSLAILRTINALGTTAILSFLHRLTGAAIPAQQMLQLVATLITVEYSGDIADIFTNMLGETLSTEQLTWFNVLADGAAPAAAALIAGAAYSVAKNVVGFFRKPSDASNDENKPLATYDPTQLMTVTKYSSRFQ